MGERHSRALLDPLFTTGVMRDIFSDRGRLQGMLDFEAALARAEARLGVIPESAVGPIASRCRAELFDVDDLALPHGSHRCVRFGIDAVPSRYSTWVSL